MRPLMSQRLLILGLSVGLILGAVLASFLIARLATNDSGPSAEAQVPPEPTPAVSAQDAIQRIEEDNARTPFQGEINAITFTDTSDGSVEVRPVACRASEVLPNSGVASREEIAASPLDFMPGYLPSDMTLVFEEAQKCQGEVTSIIRNYGRQDGALVVVAHVAAPAIFPPNAPRDRLEAITIGGRQAVLQKSLFSGKTPLNYTLIYVLDEAGYWMVSGKQLDEAEVIQVAEGLQ